MTLPTISLGWLYLTGLFATGAFFSIVMWWGATHRTEQFHEYKVSMIKLFVPLTLIWPITIIGLILTRTFDISFVEFLPDDDEADDET